jgi:hypothetical protein
MHYSAYARAVLAHLDEVEKKAAPSHEIHLSSAREAAQLWEAKAQALEARMWGRALSPENRARFNALLMEVERTLAEDRGQGRPFFKHLIYAPQPTYRDGCFLASGKRSTREPGTDQG